MAIGVFLERWDLNTEHKDSNDRMCKLNSGNTFFVAIFYFHSSFNLALPMNLESQ